MLYLIKKLKSVKWLVSAQYDFEYNKTAKFSISLNFTATFLLFRSKYYSFWKECEKVHSFSYKMLKNELSNIKNKVAMAILKKI